MKILVIVMFWLDVVVLAALCMMPHTPALWMWGVSLLHLVAAGWMWHTGYFEPPPDYRAEYETECAAHRKTQEISDKLFSELQEDHRQVLELWKAEEARGARMCQLFYEYYYTGGSTAKRHVDARSVN